MLEVLNDIISKSKEPSSAGGEHPEKISKLLGEHDDTLDKYKDEEVAIDEPVNWLEEFHIARILVRNQVKMIHLLDEQETNKCLQKHYPDIYRIDDLMFVEKLFIYDKKKRKMGIFRLNVTRMDHLKNLEVIAEATHRCKKEQPEYSKMHSYGVIDLIYRTFCEERNEIEMNRNIETHRKIKWETTDNMYKLTKFLTIGPNYQTQYESWYSPTKMSKLLSESAFIILLRYLAGTKFSGLLKFYLLFISGEKCLCNLKVMKTTQCKYKENKIKVKWFIKLVRCPNNEIQISNIVMTQFGQIIYQDWSNSELHLMLDLAAVLIQKEKPLMNPDNLVPLRERFYERRELYDFYTDEFYRNLEKFKNYFRDKPEIVRLLKLFLNEILLKKPHRVCHFASNYFCELL